MIVAVTGTRKGATLQQLINFNSWLFELEEVEKFLHGDCIGADAQAFECAKQLDWFIRTEAFPGCDKYGNSPYREYTLSDFIHPVQQYIKRNHIMVDMCDVLAVIPEQREEIYKGSGTWATKRYAEKTGTQFKLFLPEE